MVPFSFFADLEISLERILRPNRPIHELFKTMVALFPSVAPDQVTISCYAPAEIKRMRAIGDFNGWNAPGETMHLTSDGLNWELKLNLEPGVYRYVLIEDSRNVPVGSAFQKKVQVLVLTPNDFSLYPGVKGDGLITNSGVAHFQDARDISRINEITYRLLLRTRKNDVDQESVAVWSKDGEQKNYPLHFQASDPLFDYYSAKVVVNPTKTFYYRFLLDDGHGIRAFDGDGLSTGTVGGKPFQIESNQFKPKSTTSPIIRDKVVASTSRLPDL